MISVETIFQRVNFDLIQKGKGQYTSNDTFNRDLEQVQNELYSLRLTEFESMGVVSDSLSPFLKEVTLDIVTNLVTKPDDYRHLVDMRYMWVQNVEGCAEPTITLIPMDYCSPNEEYLALTSPIRKNSRTKKHINYSLVNDKFRVYENGRVLLKYLRVPNPAVRAVQVNVTTDEEDYDSVNTVDLEWEMIDYPIFVAMMLQKKALETKDTQLLK